MGPDHLFCRVPECSASHPCGHSALSCPLGLPCPGQFPSVEPDTLWDPACLHPLGCHACRRLGPVPGCPMLSVHPMLGHVAGLLLVPRLRRWTGISPYQPGVADTPASFQCPAGPGLPWCDCIPGLGGGGGSIQGLSLGETRLARQQTWAMPAALLAMEPRCWLPPLSLQPQQHMCSLALGAKPRELVGGVTGSHRAWRCLPTRALFQLPPSFPPVVGSNPWAPAPTRETWLLAWPLPGEWESSCFLVISVCLSNNNNNSLRKKRAGRREALFPAPLPLSFRTSPCGHFLLPSSSLLPQTLIPRRLCPPSPCPHPQQGVSCAQAVAHE